MRIALIVLAVIVVSVGIGLVAAGYYFGLIFNPSPTAAPKERSMYEFTMKDIDGNDVALSKYKGSVVMLVNTASRCGLTPQYEGLQKIFDQYKDKGFVVLGFPANNFLGQEPGTEKEIKEFCQLNYKVSFLMHKETNPGFHGDITLNFEKFLVGKDVKVVARFAPSTLPDAPEVTKAIEAELSK